MAELVEELFGYFLELFENPKKKVRARQKEFLRKVALASEMQEQITAYLVECSRETISESLATTINSLVRIVTELESIADTTNKLIVLAQQKSEKDVKLDQALVEGILPYSEMVQRFLAFNKAHLQSALTDREFQQAAEMEEEINAAQRDLKRRSQKRIRRGSSAKAELYYIDVLRHIEHIGDYSLAISSALTRIR
jgi:phosphate:Na+ symporter